MATRRHYAINGVVVADDTSIGGGCRHGVHLLVLVVRHACICWASATEVIIR